MKKVLKKIWGWIIAPFKWIWKECKDIKTLIIFIIVFLVLSSEVWVFYLLGLIFQNNWFFGIASACWAFWLGPGTPFLPLCIGVTMGIKQIFNVIKKRKEKKNESKIKEIESKSKDSV